MRYEIRVRPALDAALAACFEPWETSSLPDGSAALTGWAGDQDALHGVLAKVRDLNLRLISVNPLTEERNAGRDAPERNENENNELHA